MKDRMRKGVVSEILIQEYSSFLRTNESKEEYKLHQVRRTRFGSRLAGSQDSTLGPMFATKKNTTQNQIPFFCLYYYT